MGPTASHTACGLPDELANFQARKGCNGSDEYAPPSPPPLPLCIMLDQQACC